MLQSCVFHVLNHADDFAGAEQTHERAQLSFVSLGQLLADLNLIESESKACAPDTSMTYLGVLFDTVEMKLYVDSEKLLELKSELIIWVRKTVAKKSDLQSILGKLLWVSKTVRFSRIFVSRIIAEIRKLSKQSKKTVQSTEIRKDFLWWSNFIEISDGVEIIPAPTVSFAVYGDACVQGGGGWNPSTSEYFSLRFPHNLLSSDIPIHIKEFYILILEFRSLGSSWSGQKIVLYCDNDAVCDSRTNLKPKDTKMQKLVREFLYWVCLYKFFPIVTKIGTKENHVADFLSRVYSSDEIDRYFASVGCDPHSKIEIPETWFNFKADW